MSLNHSHYSQYHTAGDFGRFSPEEAAVEEKTIICPQVTKQGEPMDRPSMTKTQCLTRIKEESPCTEKCPIATELKKSLHNDKS